MKGVRVRGYLRKLILPFAAVAICAAAGTAGGAVKAGSTLVFAGAADPTYLDPALVSDGESFRVTEQIDEGLIGLKPGTTKIIPKLATKWKLSGGGRTWTFFLRHGVKFHETFGNLAYIIKCRVDGLRDFGTSMAPFNSFLN